MLVLFSLSTQDLQYFKMLQQIFLCDSRIFTNGFFIKLKTRLEKLEVFRIWSAFPQSVNIIHLSQLFFSFYFRAQVRS